MYTNGFPVKHNTSTNVFVNNFVNRPLDDILILMLMLRPFKFKFLNWNTNKDKLLDPALVYDMNDINDISDINDINDDRKISFDKPGVLTSLEGVGAVIIFDDFGKI